VLAGQLSRISEVVHDCWFSVDDIEFEPVEGRWRVPISREPTARPPKVESLRGVRGAKLLEICGVRSFLLEDSERVKWYDVTELRYEPSSGIISVVTGIPLKLKLETSLPVVRLVEQ
jgi:hypothetical protein